MAPIQPSSLALGHNGQSGRVGAHLTTTTTSEIQAPFYNYVMHRETCPWP
jgi:hypothetical protein